MILISISLNLNFNLNLNLNLNFVLYPLGSQTTVFINCMILKSSVGIYKEVARQLNNKSVVKGEKDALKEIEKIITSKGEMILLGKKIISTPESF